MQPPLHDRQTPETFTDSICFAYTIFVFVGVGHYQAWPFSFPIYYAPPEHNATFTEALGTKCTHLSTGTWDIVGTLYDVFVSNTLTHWHCCQVILQFGLLACCNIRVFPMLFGNKRSASWKSHMREQAVIEISPCRRRD